MNIESTNLNESKTAATLNQKDGIQQPHQTLKLKKIIRKPLSNFENIQENTKNKNVRIDASQTFQNIQFQMNPVDQNHSQNFSLNPFAQQFFQPQLNDINSILINQIHKIGFSNNIFNSSYSQNNSIQNLVSTQNNQQFEHKGIKNQGLYNPQLINIGQQNEINLEQRLHPSMIDEQQQNHSDANQILFIKQIAAADYNLRQLMFNGNKNQFQQPMHCKITNAQVENNKQYNKQTLSKLLSESPNKQNNQYNFQQIQNQFISDTNTSQITFSNENNSQFQQKSNIIKIKKKDILSFSDKPEASKRISILNTANKVQQINNERKLSTEQNQIQKISLKKIKLVKIRKSQDSYSLQKQEQQEEQKNYLEDPNYLKIENQKLTEKLQVLMKECDQLLQKNELIKRKFHEEKAQHILQLNQQQEDIRIQVQQNFDLLKDAIQNYEEKIEIQKQNELEDKQTISDLKNNLSEVQTINKKCFSQIISIIIVFIHLVKYFLQKCMQQQNNQFGAGCASLSNYSQINPLGALSNLGFRGRGLNGSMSSITVTENLMDRSFDDERKNMFEQIKSLLIAKIQSVQLTLKTLDLSNEIQNVKDWEYEEFIEQSPQIYQNQNKPMSPMADLITDKKKKSVTNKISNQNRKGSINLGAFLQQAPSLRNLNTVRTQNSDKNNKKERVADFYNLGLESSMGQIRMPDQKYYKDLAYSVASIYKNNQNHGEKMVQGHFINENNSLIMGSFENFDQINNMNINFDNQNQINRISKNSTEVKNNFLSVKTGQKKLKTIDLKQDFDKLEDSEESKLFFNDYDENNLDRGNSILKSPLNNNSSKNEEISLQQINIFNSQESKKKDLTLSSNSIQKCKDMNMNKEYAISEQRGVKVIQNSMADIDINSLSSYKNYQYDQIIKSNLFADIYPLRFSRNYNNKTMSYNENNFKSSFNPVENKKSVSQNQLNPDENNCVKQEKKDKSQKYIKMPKINLGKFAQEVKSYKNNYTQSKIINAQKPAQNLFLNQKKRESYDFQRNTNFTHRGTGKNEELIIKDLNKFESNEHSQNLNYNNNILHTDYSFESFEAFNAKKKLDNFPQERHLKTDCNLTMEKNNSIYQPSKYFGQINKLYFNGNSSQLSSHGNLSQDFKILKNNYNNLLDSEKGYVSDSFSGNKVKTGFKKSPKDKKLQKKYSLDSVGPEKNQQNLIKIQSNNQYNRPIKQSSLSDEKNLETELYLADNDSWGPNINTNKKIACINSRNINFRENKKQQNEVNLQKIQIEQLQNQIEEVQDSSVTINAFRRSITFIDKKQSSNNGQNYFDISKEQMSQNSKIQRHTTTAQQSNFKIDIENINSKRNSFCQQDVNLQESGQFKNNLNVSDGSSLKEKVEENQNHNQIWNQILDSAEFVSLHNTNENYYLSDDEVVSFENLGKIIMQRGKGESGAGEDTLGAVLANSNSQITKQKIPQIGISKLSYIKQRDFQFNDQGFTSSQSQNKLKIDLKIEEIKSDMQFNQKNPDEFYIQNKSIKEQDFEEDELPVFGHHKENKEEVLLQFSNQFNQNKHKILTIQNLSKIKLNLQDQNECNMNNELDSVGFGEKINYKERHSTRNLTDNNQIAKPNIDKLNQSGTLGAKTGLHREGFHGGDSFGGSFGDMMAGSIKSSSSDSNDIKNCIEKLPAASENGSSNQSVELLMQKSAKSANIDFNWGQNFSKKKKSGLVKLAKSKTNKISNQLNIYNQKRGKIINSYFRDSESLSPKQKCYISQKHESSASQDNKYGNMSDEAEKQKTFSISKLEANQNASNKQGSGSHKISQLIAQSVHSGASFYQHQHVDTEPDANEYDKQSRNECLNNTFEKDFDQIIKENSNFQLNLNEIDKKEIIEQNEQE